jgi:hypothetical protein
MHTLLLMMKVRSVSSHNILAHTDNLHIRILPSFDLGLNLLVFPRRTCGFVPYLLRNREKW